MMNSRTLSFAARFIGLTALVCVWSICTPVRADEITQDVGFRVWSADWKSGSVDVGSGQLYSIYYDAFMGDWGLSTMLGIGDGWAINADDLAGELGLESPGGGDIDINQRLDLWLMLSRPLFRLFNDAAALTMGLGYHYFGWDSDFAQVFYHGPEIYAGYNQYLFAAGTASVSARVSGTYLPYLQWGALDNDDKRIADGNTDGYTLEGGLDFFWKSLIVSGGYRAFLIQEEKGFAEDDFQGAFGEIALQW
jgi:hypothetical protein